MLYTIALNLLQDTVLQLLKESMLAKAVESKGFLIDGYPREMEQGTRFETEVGVTQVDRPNVHVL